jgi:hypothetical protein
LAAFITAQELSDFLGRDVTTDDGVDLALEGACSICSTVAEQTFPEATTTIVLDGSGTDVLVLPDVPVSSVTSVSVGGSATTAYVQDNGLLLKQSGTWSRGRRNVEVKYRHGYSSSAIPADVKMVALNVAGRLLVQAPTNAIQEQVGDVSRRYAVAATDLTANELRILRAHSGR